MDTGNRSELAGLIETDEFQSLFNPDFIESGTIDLPEDEPVTEIIPDEPPPTDSSPVDNTGSLSAKLDPVPVFTIADEQGAPLVATGDDGEKVAGVFISQAEAEQFVVQLQEENPELATQVRVVPVSLGEVYNLSESAQTEESGLNFAYVPEEESVADATNVQNANGEQYEGGVPLFVARNGPEGGYLTIERDGQQVIPFFFDLEQLEDLVARFEEQRPELAGNINIDVVPLEGVIETFETSEDPILDQIVLVPTEESIEFVQSTEDSNSDRQDVYRFFNQDTGVHFYTSSEVERDSIVDGLPNFNLEGVSYEVVDPLTGMEDANVVHRFRNQDTGVHIYTINEAERSFIADNLNNYEYEGEVFAAYTSQVEGTIPVHRFYDSQLDSHFYTPSEAERESVENDLPNYNYEGIAYYAYSADG